MVKPGDTVLLADGALKLEPIAATEMLFPMMSQPRPTRADVTDITNAILDGSDAVMLSGETGMGRFPIECAKVMAKVTEAADDFRMQLEHSAVNAKDTSLATLDYKEDK